jgi:hypothetical protein
MGARADFEIVDIPGLATYPRRGVAFLVGPRRELDARDVFAGLLKNPRRTLLSRFDYWASEAPPNKRWFHGWPNDKRYKQCFVFKYNDKDIDQRMYGFLCHPRPKTAPRFQLCAIHTHDTKTSWETDKTIQELSLELLGNNHVINAIKFAYPDTDDEPCQIN